MRLFWTVILLIGACTLQAQVVVKDFYDKDGREVNEQNSYYYRVGEKALVGMKYGTYIKTDTAFIDTVKTFYTATGKIRSREYYRDGLREGAFMNYHENGKLKDKGTYHEDRRIGYMTSWYEQGSVQKVLKYFPVLKAVGAYPRDSFEVINYWSEASVQLIKDGKGYCACYLESDRLLEKGKIVNGTKDSTWQYLEGDTIRFLEKFDAGKFREGKAYRKGEEIKYTSRESIAEFPGGLQALYRFLSRNLKYPTYAKRNGIEGKVFLKFIVDKDGSLYDIKVFKGVSETLDAEALRIIKLMPRWLPGKIRGLPVKSQFVLPVYFKLDS